MSDKNYNKMYKPTNTVVEEEPVSFVEQEIECEVPTTPAEPEIIETPTAPVDPIPVPKKVAKTDCAIVVNCAKLNVREEPSPKAMVIGVIDASNEVVVYDSESFGNYYKVCTASGIEGYCVKDFLELK